MDQKINLEDQQVSEEKNILPKIANLLVNLFVFIFGGFIRPGQHLTHQALASQKICNIIFLMVQVISF